MQIMFSKWNSKSCLFFHELYFYFYLLFLTSLMALNLLFASRSENEEETFESLCIIMISA